jgi:hypothetical protein
MPIMGTPSKQREVTTKSPPKPGSTPRLPHEHDESNDSQASGKRKVIKQAYDDINAGQVDTDLHGIKGVEKVVEGQTKTPSKR